LQSETSKTPLADAGSSDVRSAEIGSSSELARWTFGLRTILFLALTAISAAPVFLLAQWVEHSKLEREIAAVREKHLLLASNLASTLSRYVDDVDAVFRHVVSDPNTEANPAQVKNLLRSLTFDHACIFDGDGQIMRFITASQNEQPLSLPTEVFASLKQQAQTAGGKVVFTDIMREAGRPVFFVLQELPGGRIAVGTLATDYMIELQRSITFGKRGHTVIVDHAGNVVAHPDKDAIASSKNIAFVSIVPSMMSGKTGVETFYSPLKKANMIAGYTVVPRTGWGVMVAQPMAELLDRAKDQVRGIALAIATLGVVLAGLIAWVLANILSRPIEAVARTARDIADGRSEIRVPAPRATAPRELRDLSNSFNSMLDELSRKQVELTNVETADRAKSQFLAAMSHELRTPLNAIIGFSEMIGRETFGPLGDPRYCDYARDICDSGRHLLALISDILDLSKVEAGAEELYEEEVEVPKLVEWVMRVMKRHAEKRKIELALDLQGAIPALKVDDRKMKQILVNLLGNAIKFTHPGGRVTFKISYAEVSGLAFQIMDTGIGMAREDIPKALSQFGRLDGYLTRQHKGTGLGLPLSKALVELHGGSLDLQSDVGVGTTVTVRIPAERVARAEDDRFSVDQAKKAAS
jgi:signal transduction histidine kinase